METPWLTKRPHPTVLLWWIWPLLSRSLSSNILREVHYYLQGPFLGQIKESRIYILDISTRVWKSAPLQIPLRVINSETFLTISTCEVFIAGYCGTQSKADNSTYILNITGEVRKQPNMLLAGEAGLFHYQAGKSVLAFGGTLNPPLRDTQCFSLLSMTWSLLQPKLKYPRCSFSPCQHLSSVYMIGGSVPQIESFCLKTFTFSVCWEQTTPLLPQAIAFPYKDKIFILQNAECGVFDLKKRVFLGKMKYSKKQSAIHNYAVLKDTVITCNFPGVVLGDLSPYEN